MRISELPVPTVCTSIRGEDSSSSEHHGRLTVLCLALRSAPTLSPLRCFSHDSSRNYVATASFSTCTWVSPSQLSLFECFTDLGPNFELAVQRRKQHHVTSISVELMLLVPLPDGLLLISFFGFSLLSGCNQDC